MKKIVIIGTSLILGAALMAVAVMAQGPGFGRGFGFGPPFGNLSPEQSSKVQALLQDYLKEIEALQ